MKISVILAHPDQRSFNYAIAETVVEQLKQNRHGVFFHDLYRENFEPLLIQDEISKDAPLPKVIAGYCEEIVEADGIIIVHPNWWGQPPAIMKGWIDRVIRPGIAYEFMECDSGEGIPKGLLRAGAAVVFNTANTLPEREESVFGDPLETIWKNCIFRLCGIHVFHRRTFSVIATSTEAQRKEWLGEVRAVIDSVFPVI
ncbi:MAG: NAD(P)H-dependent oxidoreductase [Syntrophales bacterium]|nr:NAD(P)H-dependent oxidoreductase [Syntrophales bacterium]